MKTELNQEWLQHPINCTCEVMIGHKPLKLCDEPTVAAYPAMGGGWMPLCAEHALKHLPDGAFFTDELISRGATWK